MSEKYTKYETARILGARALQISMGAPFLIKIKEDDLEALNYNPIEIAKKEFEADVIPLTVRRPLPKLIEKQRAKAA
jgi:DNA-directed RNA polymerase subunit K